MSDDIREEDLVGGSGGNAKYVIVGLLFIGAAVAAYFLTRPAAPAETAQAPTAQAPAPAPAPPPAYADDLAIAEEEPDAGVDAGQTARRPATGGGGGDWSCSGEIASAQAATAFRSHSGEVRQCYERKLRTDPMLQGTLSLRLKIGTGGTVQGVQVGGSLRDPDVVACVRERARAWRFPGPAGGCAVIAAPFTLTPRQ